MLASQAPLLQQIITTANTWRQQGQAITPAQGGPVGVDQLNFSLPEGQFLVLEWDQALEPPQYRVRTG